MPSSAAQKLFINEIAEIIQEEAKARGYKLCSPIIAQACLESNYGVSLLAARFGNYFGLKCGSSWKGPSVNLATKEEYTQGTLTTIRDNFRVYQTDGKPDMVLGVKGYFDFIGAKRYENLRSATTPREYLTKIKNDGYATSSSYVQSNLNVINRHDLQRFDWKNEAEKKNPYKLTATIMRQGSRGESVKWLQWELNRHGANLEIDGIFGIKTKLAVLLFQKDNKLSQDGIVGPKTINLLKN